MNVECSNVGAPATTQEAIGKSEHEHPMESFETYTLAGPEAPAAPKLSAPTLEWKSLMTPIGTLILAAVLALGHHTFNAWEDGKPVDAMSIVPQHWVTWIGVGFSFGFKSAIGATMGFVLLQCLWLSVVRQPLTIQQIDTIYRIERQDQLYKTLPQALFFSPTIVVFSSLMLILPLSGVFAPGSLTVTIQGSTRIGHCIVPSTDAMPCMIPTGDLSTSASTPLFTTDPNSSRWYGVTPRTIALITEWFAHQRIPDLPQVCGPNCHYEVHIPSFVFQCTPDPPSLPYGQIDGPSPSSSEITIWNGTTDPHSTWGFYIAWKAWSPSNRTSGNASCSPVQAQYDVKVQTKGGVQFVTTNITNIMSSPIPDVTNLTFNPLDPVSVFSMQLSAITYATQALFLGEAVINLETQALRHNTPTGRPSFLEITNYSISQWENVLKAVEETSYNVTAALLSLNLGTMLADCFPDQQGVYQYSPFALWVPYGTALIIALTSLIVAVIIKARNNTGDITTSFSDTAILMRNVDEDVSAGAKLRLRVAEDGKLEYILD